METKQGSLNELLFKEQTQAVMLLAMKRSIFSIFFARDVALPLRPQQPGVSYAGVVCVPEVHQLTRRILWLLIKLV